LARVSYTRVSFLERENATGAETNLRSGESIGTVRFEFIDHRRIRCTPALAAGEPDSSPCIIAAGAELRRDPGTFFAGADTDIRTIAFLFFLLSILQPFSFYLTELWQFLFFLST